jgi:hypothetical protein
MPPKKTPVAAAAAAAEGGAENVADKKSFFTAREQEILTNAFMCFREFPTVSVSPLPLPFHCLHFNPGLHETNPVQVDFDHLAARCGMTNPRSASNAWALIRKKISAAQETAPTPVSLDGNPLPPIAPPTTPGKRKASDDVNVADKGEGSSATVTKKTSAKRARATPKAKATSAASTSAAAANSDAASNGENGTHAAEATPTRAPRKRAPKKAATPITKISLTRVESNSEAETIIREPAPKTSNNNVTVPIIKDEFMDDNDENVNPANDEDVGPASDYDASKSDSGFSGIRVLHPDDSDYEDVIANGTHYTGQVLI